MAPCTTRDAVLHHEPSGREARITTMLYASIDGSVLSVADAAITSDAEGPLVRKCVRTVHGGEYWFARDQVGPMLEDLRRRGKLPELAA